MKTTIKFWFHHKAVKYDGNRLMKVPGCGGSMYTTTVIMQRNNCIGVHSTNSRSYLLWFYSITYTNSHIKHKTLPCITFQHSLIHVIKMEYECLNDV
jgi:hypothetical protein